MNHHHRKILHALFAHPVSANIGLREVEGVLAELGAELSHTGHGRLAMKLAGHSHTVHAATHALSKEDVIGVRKFLEACGIDPEAYPA